MDIMKEKLSKIENFDEKIQEISRKLESWEKNEKNTNSIKDTEIVSLNKSLKTANFSMESLFSEQ
jgi:predicted membrane chloride channel (bestrophin family)